MNERNTTVKLAAALLLVLLGNACGDQPRRPDGAAPGRPEPLSAARFNERLEQAELQLQQRQLLSAASILAELNLGKLRPRQRARSALLQAELLYLQGDIAAALALLGATRQQTRAALPPALGWRLAQREIQLLALSAAPLATAQHIAAQLERQAWPGQEQALTQTLWRQLNRCRSSDLQRARTRAAGDYWQSWLALALLAAEVTASPARQLAKLVRWQQRYAALHPAGRLPGGLGLLPSLAQQAPRRIALLLPLGAVADGAGQAVLDGFMAARYRARDWDLPSLLVLDSLRYPDSNDAYAAAVAAGAELVIGPLRAQKPAQWRERAVLPVPLLTLDWLPGSPPEPGTAAAARPWQLALSGADEVRQIARLAFAANARNALLIRPAGAWGDALAGILRADWQQRGGSMRASAVFSGPADYSGSLKAALKLAESEQRGRRIEQLARLPVLFSPRRRQDLDVIFLLADNPTDSRSIKPLIAFHYAAALPVYANSQAYSRGLQPQRDRDLDGLHLVEIPWIVTPAETPGRNPQQAPGAPRHRALRALGADAFLLHWRLPQLAASADNLIRGNTGLLYMDPHGRIHRELVPTRIPQGPSGTRLMALPKPVLTTSQQLPGRLQ